MAIAAWLRRLLKREKRQEPPREAVGYRDYTITPTPIATPAGYVTAGIIRKHTPEGVREHRFIRADTHSNADDAAAFAIRKGQQIIDQLGDRIFET